MTGIHPTAIVEAGAELGAGVRIGPYCVVGPRAKLADGVRLEAHVVVAGRTTLGPNSRLFPFASVGCQPQDTKYAGADPELVIGANTLASERTEERRVGKEGDSTCRR